MNSADTHYAKVASRLRERIQSGKLQPGEKLPAERSLCGQFKLSRITIRQALQLLEDEHLVERRHGSGTYVSPHPTYRIPLMIDYTGSMFRHAPGLTRRLLKKAWKPAGHEVSVVLAINKGEEFFYAERVDDLAGEKSVAWDQVHLAAPFAAGLKPEHLNRVDFIEIWAKACRIELESCRQSVEATGASAEDKRHIGIAEGKPVLKTTEIFFARGGKPAGMFISHYHPDRIFISSAFNWKTLSRQPK